MEQIREIRQMPGRTLVYEGDDPEGFRQEMIRRHDFDPAASPGEDPPAVTEGVLTPHGPGSTPTWNAENFWAFWAPETIFYKIYNNPDEPWPLGS